MSMISDVKIPERSEKFRPSAVSSMFIAGLLVAAGIALAPAAKAEAVMLVYDASGSMRDPLADGRARVTVARQVVTKVLDAWSPRTPIGLVAYGHRTRACDDVETVLPLAPVDPVRARRIVGNLQPYGNTPLLTAIEQAGEAMADVPGESSVVVITDGGENCRPDPCGAARRLSERLGTRVHIIAFDMLAAESEVLTCITRETGGELFLANDAESLADAVAGALSQTGLTGAIYRARMQAERSTRLIEEGDTALERLSRNREAATAHFKAMKDLSGGVLAQLSEDSPLWLRLQGMVEEFSLRARETDARAFATGERRWREIAAMWQTRANRAATLLDDIRTERARAASVLIVVDEQSEIVSQLVALGLADQAIAILRQTRDEITDLNGSLVAVIDEADALLAEERVTP